MHNRWAAFCVVFACLGGVAACKGDETGGLLQPCGPNGECDPGLECDPITNTCQLIGGGIDAPPAPTIDAGIDAPPLGPPPETTLVQRPPASTQSDSATFTFSSDQSPVTFECSLDGAAFATCPTPQTFNGLSEGSHTFQVRARNSDDQVDASPESYTWEVDNAPPNTTITSGPSGDIATSELAYEFTCDDPPCTFECHIDAAAFASCDSGDSFGGLTIGTHTFEVRATDSAGNVDPTPDSRTVNVTATTPETVITSAPPESTNQTTATFEFKCVEAALDVPCTFVCSLDGATATACTTGQTYNGLAPGPHHFTVLGTTDPGGKVDPTAAFHDWNIDLTAPVVTILTGPQNGETTGRQVSFTYSADSPVHLFECAIDGTFEECSSDGVTFLSLTGGEHTFSVRATDDAGNVSAPATRTFTVDAEGPIVTLTSPGPISGPSGTLIFTATDASPPITTRCSVNGSPFVDCVSGFMYSNVPGGPIDLQIEATDRFGNVSVTTFPVTIDATGPNVSITAPQNGEATAADGTVTFVADADTVRTTCTIDGADTPCSGTSFNFINLLTGDHTTTVTAYDEFDNAGPPASVTWPVDADHPIVTILSPTNGQITCFTVTAQFDTIPSDDIVTYQCATDLNQLQPCFEATGVTFTYTGGTHTIRVLATDAVGNVSEQEATVTFTVDDVAPTGTITAPRALAEELEVTCSTGDIDFTAEDDALTTDGVVTYVASSCEIDRTFIESLFKFGGGGQGDIGPPPFPAPCVNTAGNGSDLAYSGGPPTNLSTVFGGFYTVGLTVTDACGNETTLTRDFNVDTSQPNVDVFNPVEDSRTCTAGPIDYTFVDFATTLPAPAYTTSAILNASVCTPGGTPCTTTFGGVPGQLGFTGLLDQGSEHVVNVVVTDACGNANVPFDSEGTGFNGRRNFFTDSTAPTIDANSFVFNPGIDGTATFSFDVNDQSVLGSAEAGLVFYPNLTTPSAADIARCSCAPGATTDCTCNMLSAGQNFIAARAVDTCGNAGDFTIAADNDADGIPDESAFVTFGAFEGRGVVIGNDYLSPATPAEVIGNAAALPLFVRNNLFVRPLRLLGVRGFIASGSPQDTAMTNARTAMISFVTANYGGAPVYHEMTDPTLLDRSLPGHDAVVLFSQPFDDSFLFDPLWDAFAILYHPTLEPFMGRGGVFIITNGETTDLSGLTTASGTYRIMSSFGTKSNPVQPFIRFLEADAFVLPGSDPILHDINAAYPLSPIYWVSRTPPGGALFTSYPFATTTTGFSSFLPPMGSCCNEVFSDGAAMVYEEAWERDETVSTTTFRWPVVIDKSFGQDSEGSFGDYRIDVFNVGENTALPIGEGGGQGTGGPFQITVTGNFDISGLNNVPFDSFTCFYSRYPGFDVPPDTPKVACNSVNPPTADSGFFSYTLTVDPAVDFTQTWYTVITLVENGEPRNQGIGCYSRFGNCPSGGE